MNQRVRKRGFREKGLSSTGLCIITVTLESPGNLKRKLRLFLFSGSHVGLRSHHVRYPYDASTNQMISDWSLRESDSFLRDMSTDSDVLASHRSIVGLPGG